MAIFIAYPLEATKDQVSYINSSLIDLAKRGLLLKGVKPLEECDPIELSIECVYEDQSFTHEFGTEKCGEWQIENVEYEGVAINNMPLSDKDIDKIREKAEDEYRSMLADIALCEEESDYLD